MSEKKFFICKHCGNIIGMIHASGVPVVCCGENMTELVANTAEASNEKHLPEVSIEGNTVKAVVGSVLHPMEEKHWIQWIYLETNKAGHRYCLKPGEAPEAIFHLAEGEKPLAVYEYCNLHSLWLTKL